MNIYNQVHVQTAPYIYSSKSKPVIHNHRYYMKLQILKYFISLIFQTQIDVVKIIPLKEFLCFNLHVRVLYEEYPKLQLTNLAVKYLAVALLRRWLIDYGCPNQSKVDNI